MIALKHIVDVRIVEFPPYMVLFERVFRTCNRLFNKVTEQTGVLFNYEVTSKSYKAAVDDLKNYKGCDLIPGMMYSEANQICVSFSQPIYSAAIANENLV